MIDLHCKNILHRDLKPANILMGRRRFVYFHFILLLIDYILLYIGYYDCVYTILYNDYTYDGFDIMVIIYTIMDWNIMDIMMMCITLL